LRLNEWVDLFFHLSFGVWNVGLWKSSFFAPPMDVVSGLIWGECLYDPSFCVESLFCKEKSSPSSPGFVGPSSRKSSKNRKNLSSIRYQFGNSKSARTCELSGKLRIFGSTVAVTEQFMSSDHGCGKRPSKEARKRQEIFVNLLKDTGATFPERFSIGSNAISPSSPAESINRTQ
jgi:hypothetical protein